MQQILTAFNVRDEVLTTDFEKAQADRILRRAVPAISSKLPMFIELWRLPLGNQPIAMKLSPDGRQIALGFKDGSVRRVDADNSLSIEGNLPKHEARIETLVFDAKGKQLLTADFKGWMNIWDLDQGKGLMPPFRFQDEKARSIEFLPENNQLVFGMESGALKFMDWTQGPSSTVTANDLLVSGNTKSPSITSLRSLDSKTLIASTLDGQITFWDLESKTLKGKPILAFPTETFASVDVHIMPNGKSLLAWAFGPDLAPPQLWDLITRQKEGPPLAVLQNFGGFVFPKDSSFVAATDGTQYRVLSTSDWTELQGPLSIMQTLGACV